MLCIRKKIFLFRVSKDSADDLHRNAFGFLFFAFSALEMSSRGIAIVSSSQVNCIERATPL